MILNDKDYANLWARVYAELKFSPCSRAREEADDLARPPFRIDGPHAVYGIEGMTADQRAMLEQAALDAFCAATAPGERLYAMDWQHAAFLFDPRKLEDMQPAQIIPLPGSGLSWPAVAEFPAFYPDGDYHFFIDEQFRFGYLGHPWRREAWIFGKPLMTAFAALSGRLGWHRIG